MAPTAGAIYTYNTEWRCGVHTQCNYPFCAIWTFLHIIYQVSTIEDCYPIFPITPLLGGTWIIFIRGPAEGRKVFKFIPESLLKVIEPMLLEAQNVSCL